MSSKITARILFFVFVCISLFANGQISPSRIVRIQNINTEFGSNLPNGTIILDISTAKMYQTLKPVESTKSISSLVVGTDYREFISDIAYDETSWNNNLDAATKNAVRDELELKENISNKSAEVTLGTSDDLFPTQNAVKSYVDGKTSVLFPGMIQDADHDTKLQVEKSTDDDKIHFDLAGTEKWVMDGSRLESKNSGLSVFIGEGAGLNDDQSNNSSVFVGYQDGYSNTSGNNNTALGYQSLYSNSTGNNNVAIGYQAGYNETGSNKLYIENSNSTAPLIYGEFDNNLLRVNGDLDVTGLLSIRGGSPGAGKILTSDADGDASWQTAATNGTVTNVTSATTDQLTVASETSTPVISIVTADVADDGTALATGNQIYDFVTGQAYLTSETQNLSSVLSKGTDANSKITNLTTPDNDQDAATKKYVDDKVTTSSAFATTANVTSNSPGALATDDFVFGSSSLEDIAGTADDNHMFFDKSKGAFRAGSASSTFWDEAKRGNYSIALGLDATAAGIGSIAFGKGTIAGLDNSIAMGEGANALAANSIAIGYGTKTYGDYSTALGYATFANGDYSNVFGYWSVANGDYSTAFNYNAIANGESSAAFGHYTNADSYLSFTLGRFNVGGGTADTWVPSESIFEVGIGTDNSSRTNALTVYKNGNMDLSGTLKVGTYTLPNTDGSNGQVLATDGSGTMSWTTPSSSYLWTRNSSTSTLSPSASADHLKLAGRMAINGADISASTALNLNIANGEHGIHSIATQTSANAITVMYNEITNNDMSYPITGVHNHFTNVPESSFYSFHTSGTVFAGSAVFNDLVMDGLFAHGVYNKLTGAGAIIGVRNDITPTDSGHEIFGTATTINGGAYNNHAYGIRISVSGAGENYGVYVTNDGGDSYFGDQVQLKKQLLDADGDVGTAGQVLSSTGYVTDWVNAVSPTFSTTSNVTSNAPGTLATDDFVFGSTSLDNVTGTDDDNRIFFDKSKGAFRAGNAAHTMWDQENTGDYSIALGYSTKAAGQSSTALGFHTEAIGNFSFSSGWDSNANGQSSAAFNQYTTANGNFSSSFGASTTADSYASFAIGYNNTGGGSAISLIPTDPLFEIGNGADGSNKNNALTVFKNGNAELQGTFKVGAYTLPSSDGADGQVLVTNGSGTLSWTAAAASTLWTRDAATSTISPTTASDHLKINGQLALNGADTGTGNAVNMNVSQGTMGIRTKIDQTTGLTRVMYNDLNDSGDGTMFGIHNFFDSPSTIKSIYSSGIAGNGSILHNAITFFGDGGSGLNNEISARSDALVQTIYGIKNELQTYSGDIAYGSHYNVTGTGTNYSIYVADDGGDTYFGDQVQLKNQLLDADGDVGTSGQVLSSTGTATNWINAVSSDTDWTISGNDMYSAVSGNVGIGKTSPSEKLEVTGNIKASGGISSGISSISLNSKNVTFNNAMTFSGADNMTYNLPAGGPSIHNIPSLNLSNTWSYSQLTSINAPASNATTLQLRNTGAIQSGLGACIKMELGSSGTYHHRISTIATSGTGESDFKLEYYNGSSYSTQFLVKSTGSIGIGTSSPDASYKLDVSGAGRYTGNLTIGNPTIDHIGTLGILSEGDLVIANDAEIDGDLWVDGSLQTPSDLRLKTNIEKLTNVIEKIDQLRGVRFEYKDQTKYATGPKIGVIAQELQKVYPELVKTGEDGFLAVDYTQITAILIQAVKEQQTQIKDQQAQINKLSNKLELQQVQINNILRKLK